MVKIKQSPKLPAEERRQQILMSAQTLFAKKGYKETTTDQIAKKAKLTKGALYFHFKNKEDILFELVKYVMGNVDETVKANESKLKKPSDYLKIFFEPSKLGCEHDELCQNLDFWVQAMTIPKIMKFMNQSSDRMTDHFCATFGSKIGRTKKDRKQAALFTFAVIDGLMVRQVMNPSIIDINSHCRIIDKLVEAGNSK